METPLNISIEDIQKSANRIAPFIHKTPVLTSQSINEIAGAELFFKCENFQKVGAFKMRGAANAVFSLVEQDCILFPAVAEQNSVLFSGAAENNSMLSVCTHSSGNFAQALALSAKLAGIKAYIVMPRTAPDVKKNAVLGYGAEVILCEPTLEAREKTLAEVVKKTGATFIHPYNDYRVIAGHASIVIELLDELIPPLHKERGLGGEGFDFIISPVGGGGLISGIALATHHLSPQTKVIGAEPEGAADAALSLKTGKIQSSVNPKTIADGLLTSLGDKTFPIIHKYVNEIILVSDKEIISAMKLIWERMKIIVEPSSCVTLAAVLKEKEKFRNKKIVLILSGGNVDLSKLPF